MLLHQYADHTVYIQRLGKILPFLFLSVVNDDSILCIGNIIYGYIVVLLAEMNVVHCVVHRGAVKKKQKTKQNKRVCSKPVDGVSQIQL